MVSWSGRLESVPLRRARMACFGRVSAVTSSRCLPRQCPPGYHSFRSSGGNRGCEEEGRPLVRLEKGRRRSVGQGEGRVRPSAAAGGGAEAEEGRERQREEGGRDAGGAKEVP